VGQSHKELAITLDRQGKHTEGALEWDKAVAACTKAIDLAPAAWEGWSNRAFVRFQRQEWDEAISDFSKAIELAPHLHMNWWHRGHAYLSLAQWDQAAADFGYVIDHWPDGGHSWYLRAQALTQSNQPDKALADLRQAIARGFNDVGLLKSHALLEPIRGRVEFRELLRELEKNEKPAARPSDPEALRMDVADARQRAVEVPCNPAYQLELGRSLCSLAGVLSSVAKHDEAEIALREAILVFKELASRHPQEDPYRRDAAVALRQLGEKLRGTDRTANALEALRAAIELCSGLSGGDIRVLLGHSLWDLAGLLSSAGRNDEAEQSLRGALETFEDLAASSPKNFWYRQEQGFAHWRVGWLMNQVGRPAEAVEPFRRALVIYRQLAEDDPKTLVYRIRLAQSYNELAQALVRQGKQAEAAVESENAAAEFTKVIAMKPDAGEGWSGRAFVHFHRQQWEAAIADFSKAIELAPQVHSNWWHRGHAYLNLAQWEKAAADFGYVTDHWQEGGRGWYLRAVALANLNQAEGAMADLRQAVTKGFDDVALMTNDSRLAPLRAREDFGKLLQEVEPKSANAQNNLAWLLATCPETALRDPRRAVALASNAVELEPNQGTFQNTLGAARYRAGDWAAAVEALNKSMELREGGDAFDWFFLAMAEWQLGNKDAARDWYDKAGQWINANQKALERNQGHVEELKRFRTEAKDVLGIKEQ
jgi:tetratricopeptide (TPR) repeat protein